jgi:Na+(H+)/acetate symporter ActP
VIPLIAILGVVVATLLVGSRGWRGPKSTSDFLVASRAVRPALNASAISGEYLSAASFLGVAGLVMRYGFDMAWYPVGYTAGYLLLLLLVAAPLRRSGAYTIPDFAEARLLSPKLRRVAACFVILIGVFYLLPQLKGAGITLQTALGLPYWVGVVVVGAVIVANIAVRGMRSVTLAQAFLYWVKLVAISLPAIFLVIVLGGTGSSVLTGTSHPQFTKTTSIRITSALSIEVATPESVVVRGELDGHRFDGPVALRPGQHVVGAPTTLVFAAGSRVPVATGQPDVAGSSWSAPFGSGQGTGHPVFFVYSLLLATVLGTMGLPHILVRFYTNRDGRDARRTTLAVIGLISVFYLFPSAVGALGRALDPQLYLTGNTDSVVLALPTAAIPGLNGRLLAGLVDAGAIAAFLSTSSGLLVSVAGALSHDLFGRSVAGFRTATVAAGIVAILAGLRVAPFDINVLVGWAFAIAASSFCPLLVLGIWWRRLTPTGAIAGLVTGGGLASGAIVLTMLGVAPSGWWGSLLAEPAAWTVPLAFATMISVSLLTSDQIPAGTTSWLLTVHAPESLGLTPSEVASDLQTVGNPEVPQRRRTG